MFLTIDLSDVKGQDRIPNLKQLAAKTGSPPKRAPKIPQNSPSAGPALPASPISQPAEPIPPTQELDKEDIEYCLESIQYELSQENPTVDKEKLEEAEQQFKDVQNRANEIRSQQPRPRSNLAPASSPSRPRSSRRFQNPDLGRGNISPQLVMAKRTWRSVKTKRLAREPGSLNFGTIADKAFAVMSTGGDIATAVNKFKNGNLIENASVQQLRDAAANLNNVRFEHSRADALGTQNFNEFAQQQLKQIKESLSGIKKAVNDPQKLAELNEKISALEQEIASQTGQQIPQDQQTTPISIEDQEGTPEEEEGEPEVCDEDCAEFYQLLEECLARAEELKNDQELKEQKAQELAEQDQNAASSAQNAAQALQNAPPSSASPSSSQQSPLGELLGQIAQLAQGGGGGKNKDEDEQADDQDQDQVADASDNCPGDFNPDQSDIDEDGIGDACDPEPTVASEETETTTPTVPVSIESPSRIDSDLKF